MDTHMGGSKGKREGRRERTLSTKGERLEDKQQRPLFSQ